MNPIACLFAFLLFTAPTHLPADDAAQLGAALRHSLSEIEGRLRAAQQRHAPLAAQVESLKLEIEERLRQAHLINERSNKLQEALKGVDERVQRDVLKVALRLGLETAQSLMITGVADLGADIVIKGIDALSKANDAPDEGGQRPKHYLVQLAEFREAAQRSNALSAEAIKRLHSEVEELRAKLAPLQVKADQALLECNRLVKELDQTGERHRRILEDFLKAQRNSQAESAARTDSYLAKPPTPAGADFSPYFERLKRIADAHRQGAWPVGRSFVGAWDEVLKQASAQHGSLPQDDAVRAAWKSFKDQAGAMRESLLREARERAKELEDLDREAGALNLQALKQALAGAAEGAPERARRFLTRSSTLEFRVGPRAPLQAYSPAEWSAERKALESGAKDLSAALAYADAQGPVLGQSLAAAHPALLALQVRAAALIQNSGALLALVGRPGTPRLEQAGQDLDAGVAAMTQGAFSADFRSRVLAKQSETATLLARLDEQAGANRRFEEAAKALTQALRRRGRPAPPAGLDADAVAKVAQTARAAKDWASYRKRLEKDPRSALDPASRNTLQALSLAGHRQQAAEAKRIHAAGSRSVEAHAELNALLKRLADRRDELSLQSASNRELEGALEGARADADAWRKAYNDAQSLLPDLQAYLELLPDLEALEKGELAWERAYLERLRRIQREVKAVADPAELLGRWYDKADGRFIGVPADVAEEHHRRRSLELPFASSVLEGLRGDANLLQAQLEGLAVSVRKAGLEGPAVTELVVAGLRLHENPFIGSFSLDQEDLVGGAIELRGRCSVPGSALDSVKVSFDGGASWGGQASVEGADRFVFRLSPQSGGRWRLSFQARDKRGNVGPVFPWSQPPELRYSGFSQTEAVKQAVQDLAAAYSSKSRLAFMRGVSLAFQGYHENLQAGLERDFAAYDSVTLRVEPEKVLFAPERREAQVDVRWSRSWVKQPGGNSAREQGSTRFRFSQEEGRWRLLALQGQALFGTAVDDAILRPTKPDGPSSILPVRRGQILQNHMSFVMSSGACGQAGFNFGSGGVVSSFPGPLDLDFYLSNDELRSDSGGIYEVGPASLESVQTAPSGGYGFSALPSVGHVYVIKAGGAYAKLQLRSIDTNPDCTGRWRWIIFDWVYQPNGSPDLR